ncbi:MAG: glycoside hydrolase family 13 protein [Eggerthellaceae bacterium]|nr:glycoside hydrolase family 13 protein [Eggerthellaceae bacterium]
MGDFDRVKWAISHDPCRSGDRTPSGAVPFGTVVRLRLHINESVRSAVSSVSVLVGEHAQEQGGLVWTGSPLTAYEDGFEGYLATGNVPRVMFYVFRLHLEDGAVAYYVPRADGRATAGELVLNEADSNWDDRDWMFDEQRLAQRPTGEFGLAELLPGFQVTVYEPAFSTPKWVSGAIMYQIFPDRFARGPKGVRKEGLAYHRDMGRVVRLHEDWNEPVAWQPLDETSPDPRLAFYDPVDFYGGTLEGIRCNLDYLASLGVEILYLNPVFEARSNHRYDTADYERIDALLGTGEDLARLAESAKKHGISVILDAVLSHTGNDSRYFNAQGNYDGPGAAQGAQSPYFDWYDFDRVSGDVPYRCWWGDPTLPEVNEHDPAWQNYILGAGGVLERWLAAGVRGYRLDVADEIPDDVLERIRSCVKGANPEAIIIGEVWEDATTKESYGFPRTYAFGRALDSVMNYPLRSTLLGFALGVLDAYQSVSFFRLQQSNYPPQFYSCLMNLLSSHDVERLRSALALGKALRHVPRDEQFALMSSISAEQDIRAAQLQRMIVALLYALPGMPCVYYGDECGLQGGGDPFDRATMPWGDGKIGKRSDRGVDLTAFYQEIGILRRGDSALRNGSFACAAPDSEVICLGRVNGDEGVVVVAAANRSDEPRTVAFDAGAPEFGLSGDDCRIVRGISGDMSVSFASAQAQGSDLHCEDGIMRAVVPPCSTVFWRTAIG